MAQSKAIPLIMEFMSNQDLDENGLIYGYDFKITGSFPSKPKILAGLDSDTDFQSLTPAVNMTWANFLNQSADDVLAIVLCLEYINKIDLDGNDLVYGTDFDCTDGPQFLLDLEDDSGWVEPIIHMTWANYKSSL